MNKITYAVRHDKEGNIIITTFVNGRLDRRDLFSEEKKQNFINDCIKWGMTIEEGIARLKKQLDKIAEIQNKEFRELEYLENHYPGLFR